MKSDNGKVTTIFSNNNDNIQTSYKEMNHLCIMTSIIQYHCKRILHVLWHYWPFFLFLCLQYLQVLIELEIFKLIRVLYSEVKCTVKSNIIIIQVT